MSYRSAVCLLFLLFAASGLYADVHFDFDPNIGLDPAFFSLEGGDDEASRAAESDDEGEIGMKAVFEKENRPAPAMPTKNPVKKQPAQHKKKQPAEPRLENMSAQELVESIRQSQQQASDLDTECLETNDAERKKVCKKKLARLEKRIAAYQKALEKKAD